MGSQSLQLELLEVLVLVALGSQSLQLLVGSGEGTQIGDPEMTVIATWQAGDCQGAAFAKAMEAAATKAEV